MLRKDINNYIRDGIKLGVEGVTKRVIEDEISEFFGYTHRYHNFDKKAFYEWAEQSGYVVCGTPDDYEISTPTVSARVCKEVITFHDLEIYGNRCATLGLRYHPIDGLKNIIEHFPELLSKIEYDKSYIAKNFESVVHKAQQREKSTNTRQSIIKAFIESAFEGRVLTHYYEANKARLNLIMKVGQYEVKYPINNGKAEDMPTVVQHILDFVELMEKAPYGLKIRNKK